MPEILRLTFAQFQATGTDVDDLRQVLPDQLPSTENPDPIPGRVYAQPHNLYMEPNASQPKHGAYVVEVGNSCHFGTREACESYLYGFYLCEIADPDARSELMSAAPAITREYWA